MGLILNFKIATYRKIKYFKYYYNISSQTPAMEIHFFSTI